MLTLIKNIILIVSEKEGFHYSNENGNNLYYRNRNFGANVLGSKK